MPLHTATGGALTATATNTVLAFYLSFANPTTTLPALVMDTFVGFLEFKTTTGTPNSISVALVTKNGPCAAPAGVASFTPTWGSDWKGTDFNSLSTPDTGNDNEYTAVCPTTATCDETY